MGLEGMKAQLKQMQEKGQGPGVGNVDGIIDFYSAIINVVMEGTDHVSLAAEPSAEACRFTFTSKAVEGTLLDELMVAPQGGEWGSLAPYLEDGAAFNVAGKINKDTMRTAYVKLIDLLIKIAGDKMDQADAQKLRDLTVKAINSLGDGLAMTFKGGSGDSPFSFKSVIRIDDEKAYASVVEEQMKMMANGMFDKIYAAFGMNMHLAAKSETSEYEGVKVGKAMIEFSMGDGDSEQAKMIRKMFGEGLEYSWAVVNGHAVEAMGKSSGKAVRGMIDRIKSGAPGELSPELMQAYDVFMADKTDEPENDFGGTINIVRLMNLMSGFMATASDGQVKPINTVSHSNIVFAGKCTDGVLTVETVLPQAHLLEIKSAGKAFGKAMQAQVEKQKADRDSDEDADEDGADEGHGDAEKR
jgi:hypothetical protein